MAIEAPIDTIVQRLGNLNPSPEETPDPTDCWCCGTPLVRSNESYEYEFQTSSDTSVVIRKEMPAYRCPAGIVYLDPELSDRFLGVIGDEMAIAGDPSLQQSLRGESLTTTSFAPIPAAVQRFLDSNPNF